MQKKNLYRSRIKRMFQVTFTLLFQIALFFWAAGRFNIPRAWFYFIMSFIMLMINGLMLYKHNPELISQRGKRSKDIKTWDKIILVPYSLIVLALPITAGLDAGRCQWSFLPWPYALAGTLFFCIGSLFLIWSMTVNPHFEKTVCIQKERGHQVISRGPYKIIRHPGYLGMMLLNIAFPLIIGSVYALYLSLVNCILFITRTGFEDAFLRKELKGYQQFTKKTRYRLFPGIW